MWKQRVPGHFEGLDFALFAGTEGARGASQRFGWEAVERGVIVIDNGDDFRMDDRVPLVIPEINPGALRHHRGFIANPNCSTIIALMALAPLHHANRIRRFIASTYQYVSGSGRAAVRELEQQLRDYVHGNKLQWHTYPHQIALNVIPQIGSPSLELVGYTSEEAKLLFETRKILGNDSIQVSATCARVPVFIGHGIVLHIEFDKPVTPDEAQRILSNAPGISVVDDLENHQYPLVINAAGQDHCLVGRIRQDPSVEHGLILYVAGDNLRKGAALNAIQIAETIIQMD